MKPEDTAEEAAPSVVMQEAPTPELPAGKWDKVVIVAGGGRTPANAGSRKVIVAEHRGPAEMDAEGNLKAPGELKTKGYATGADIYYRTDDSVEFQAGDAPVITLGQNIRPSGSGGFSPRGLRTGPGHPAYAAANLAHQRGAKDIEIVGLSKADQESLQVWFDSPKMPQGVKVHFS